MRIYENLITNLAILDLPRTKYGQEHKQVKEDSANNAAARYGLAEAGSYAYKIFKQLLVFDQLPDDNFQSVLQEAGFTSLMQDPAFEILFRNPFERYVQTRRHHSKWEKIRKDYNSFIEWETKRRNKDNPYYNTKPDVVTGWDALPDFGKQKHNRPYEFDHLYRDGQVFAGEVYELTKNYEQNKDKDLFRAKVNSILAAAKIVFALNNQESVNNFADTEMTITNIKLSLDSYKLAHVFLNRVVESLHKIRWSKTEDQGSIDNAIAFGNRMLEKLNTRIFEMEKLFMLYLDSDFGAIEA